MTEYGWAKPKGAKKRHYFTGGASLSLCGKWSAPEGDRAPWPAANERDDCARCTRVLWKAGIGAEWRKSQP